MWLIHGLCKADAAWVWGWRRHAPCRRARCRRSAGPPAPAPTPRRRPARRGEGACRVSSTRALGAERAAGCTAQARPRTSLRVVPSSAGCSSATGTRLALRRARVRHSSGPWARGRAGLARAGRGVASAQHREHPVHRLAVARGLVHVLEVQVLPRHAHATQGSARVLTGALPLGGEWGWAGQGAVCFARRGQSRTPGSRWKMKGPL